MLDELRRWCSAQLSLAPGQLPALQAVAGDASFRCYYRAALADGRSVIVMDAPPDKEDSRPFIDIAGRLRAAGIHAPRVLASDLERGWILLEDLGDELFREAFERRDSDVLMARIFDVLARQAQAVASEGLPNYDAGRLQQELDLFPDWYLQRHRAQPFDARERQQWQSLCDLLLANAAEQPQVFVHRDFHSCNLMYLGDAEPGVIDFQDAVCGPISYDLMSILLDRYITWPRARLEAWMEDFRQRVAADIEPRLWQRWCDWMGLQRNLKIIGIFARLSYRDGKNGYLELVPRFAGYVSDVLNRYEPLRDYRELLEPRL